MSRREKLLSGFGIDPIDDKSEWETEWVGMPEFDQPANKPFSKIVVRFETEDDLNAFSELIGQKLTPRTKSIWHPQLVRGKDSHKRYVDDES